jgi:PST family polysaccharide transporter/lipopolysaccharide exporter
VIIKTAIDPDLQKNRGGDNFVISCRARKSGKAGFMPIAEKIIGFIGSKHSLRRRTLLGSHWLLIKSLALAGIDLARTVVFARILFPADYGLMALALMAIGLLESFSTTGMEIMIQRDNDHFAERLPAYWTVKVVRGIILAALAWFIAIPLAQYYQNSELIWVVRCLAVAFLIRGIAGFGNEVCLRKMEFGRAALAEIAVALPVLGLSLIFLFAFRDIRALVGLNLLNAVAFLTISYILFPWRPKLKLDLSLLKVLACFGGSIMAINIMNYFFGNFDQGVIGKLLGVEPLGFYARGYFLAMVPVAYLANVISPVFMPAFRNVINDPERLRKAFLKSFLVFAYGFTVLGVLLLIFSKAIILVVYGAKWLPLLPVFRILLIFGVIKAIVTTCPAIFFLKDKPWLITVCAAVTAVCLGVLCIPMTRAFGSTGTAWAVVLAGAVGNGLAIGLTYHLLNPGRSEKIGK